MEILLGVLASIGVGSGLVSVIAYALEVRRSSRLSIALAESLSATALAEAETAAAHERNLAIGATLARQAREIRELDEALGDLALSVGPAGVAAIRARLDRLLSPPSDDDDGDSILPSPTAGAAGTPD